MKYLHFMKYNKHWFYTFDSTDKTTTFTPPDGADDNGWIEFADSGSKTKALAMLKEKFPDDTPILTEPVEDDFTYRDKFRLEERRYKRKMRRKEEEEDLDE